MGTALEGRADSRDSSCVAEPELPGASGMLYTHLSQGQALRLHTSIRGLRR